ncbi:DUF4845 domain-containing protein [Aquitalea sp. S1-19]|nr:DUF4845 domain-containing protein [Aquitalea sp. S1-19]MCP9760577.1 DUF4845 domain-containing protein [Aquitalea sp. S1-19]
MRSREYGLSVVSLLMTILLAGALILGFFRVVPVYSEYFEIKNALNDMAKNPAPEGEWGLRQEFARRAGVNDISSIKPQDLRIYAPVGQQPAITVAWRREVPMVSNVSLLFDFNIHAGQKAGMQP